jgi:aminoglycoside phosphotransferase (APT) family kinase protein
MSTGGRFSETTMRAVLGRLCATVGLQPDDARLIKMTNNAVFHLPREGVVVRIATTARLFHRVENVIAVARWLAGTDVPAVELDDRFDQPLRAAGTLATVWRYVHPAQPPPDARSLAEVIRRWHTFDGPPLWLPRWNPIADARLRLSDANGLDHADHAYLSARYDALEAELAGLDSVLPTGVIHGDAHTGNLIRASGGAVVIADFDNTCMGPREWDLVPVAYGAARFGRRDWQQEFVEVYGHDVTRSPSWPVLRTVRELQMVASVVPILASDPGVASQFRHRLDTIRRGDHQARWQRYT